MVALKGLAHLGHAGHFRQISSCCIHCTANQPADRCDIGIILIAAALVILNAGPGMGMNADDDDVFLGHAILFGMTEDLCADALTQSQQIAADYQAAHTVCLKHHRPGIERVAHAQRTTFQIVTIASQFNTHGRGKFPNAKSGTHDFVLR